MDKIQKFVDLFSEFDMRVVEKVEKKRIKRENVNPSTIERDLKKELTRIEKEYKSAVKAFKANKIDRNALYDFEWRIFEIQEEIKRLEE